VDDDPVLLRGTVPPYRDLDIRDEGKNVRQRNRNLHELGYDADAGVDIDPDDNAPSHAPGEISRPGATSSNAQP
jgi:hypothetical protein